MDLIDIPTSEMVENLSTIISNNLFDLMHNPSNFKMRSTHLQKFPKKLISVGGKSILLQHEEAGTYSRQSDWSQFLGNHWTKINQIER